ncbi:MAG TPA: LytTR family DNA-binding domain-containing protein [Bacteroidales bacterium]|nr:LytTR family DNA-binding domain-containing protein [Bacteroidales bacterium]
MIKAVIIDDEPEVREVNQRLLNDNFTEIEIVGEADSVDSGVQLIQELKPQLVLLDIDIKGGTGFHILQKVKPYNFGVIFITAFNEFAIKAIKFSALDYILKPVNETEFCAAVQSALNSIENKKIKDQVNNFFDHYERKTQSKKIVLKTSASIYLIDISDIIYCISDNSYTTFHIKDRKDIVVSKSIKEYEKLLESYNFFRPHQSYLVNLHFINKIDKTDGGSIILNNKKEIPVSYRRKQALLQVFDKF